MSPSRAALLRASECGRCHLAGPQCSVRRRQLFQLPAHRGDQNRQVRHRPAGRPEHLRVHAVHLPDGLHPGNCLSPPQGLGRHGQPPQTLSAKFGGPHSSVSSERGRGTSGSSVKYKHVLGWALGLCPTGPTTCLWYGHAGLSWRPGSEVCGVHMWVGCSPRWTSVSPLPHPYPGMASCLVTGPAPAPGHRVIHFLLPWGMATLRRMGLEKGDRSGHSIQEGGAGDRPAPPSPQCGVLSPLHRSCRPWRDVPRSQAPVPH